MPKVLAHDGRNNRHALRASHKIAVKLRLDFSQKFILIRGSAIVFLV